MSEIVNTAEIRVVADASGVEAGLRPAIDAAQRTERAISGIGAGSARSQQNLIQAIQRTTAEMEAGSRTGARYFEVLAQQRGIDPGVIQPYLQQLRAVQEAQQGAGQSAGQTANALRQVPAQLTDVITSLQGGMEPLTVLIQQGGQIRDAFGGIGPAVRALGGQLMAVLSPYTLVAAAMATVAALYLDSVQSSDAYTRAIGETGNAAGVTTDQLTEMARALGKGDAAEALIGLTKASQVSAENIQRFAFIAIEGQRVLGKAVEETVEEFDALGGDPAKALADLNGKYHFLTAEVYAQVKALEDQGKAAEAATLAQTAYADGMEKQRYKVLDSLSDWERGWLRIKKAAGDAIDATLGIANASTNAQQITSLLKDRDRIEENIATARARRDTYSERQQQALLEQNKAQINAIRARTDAEKAAAKAEADAAALNEARMKWDDQADAFLGKKAKLEQEITKARNEGAAAGASQAEIEERIGLIRKKYEPKDTGDAARKAAAERREEARLLAELSGVTGTYLEDLSRLNGVYAKGNLSQERYVELVTELISKQPGAKKMIDETAKEMADYAKATTAANEVLDKELDAITKQIQATSDSNDQIGLSKIAIAELEAARLEALATRKEENADIALGTDLTGRQSEIYLEQAAALRTLAAAKRDGATRQAAADSAKQAADNWKKASDSIEKSLTDALLRGFESGKSIGENLIATLKNMFSTLVLRPVISAVINPASNAVASAFGFNGAGDGAAGAGGSSTNLVQTAMNAYKAMSTGFAGISDAVAGGVQTAMSAAGYTPLGSQGLATASGQALTPAASMAGTVAAYAGGAAIGVYGGRAISNGYAVGSGSGNTAVNVGTAIGAVIAGPIGAAVGGMLGGVVNRAFGMKEKEVTATGIRGTLSDNGTMGENYSSWKQKGGWFRSDKSGTDITALSADLVSQFSQGFDVLKLASSSFADAIGVSADSLSSYSKRFDIKLGKDQAANEKAVADFFAQVGDEMAYRLVPSLGQFSKSGETASATLQRLAGDFKATDAMAQMLGKSAAAVFGSSGLGSATARERLIDLAGGIDVLTQQAQTYSQNFLTEAERLKPVSEALASAMSGLGLSAVTSRVQFKQVIDSLNLTTDAGAKQYVAMMGLAEAFALVHPATEEATKDLTSYRTALTDAYNAESDALQSTISRMGTFATSLRNLNKSALLSGLSPLSPQQKYAEARAQYEAVAAAARGGDEKAQDRYQDAYTAFLEASRVVNASSGGYQKDFDYAQAMTDEVAKWAGDQVDVGQAQLDMLKSQVSGIIEINKSVLSVRDALLQYNEAMRANTAPLVAMAPPTVTAIPYDSYGTQNTEALVAELKSVRAELASLRGEQRQQTGAQITGVAGAVTDSAIAIVRAVTGMGRRFADNEERVAPE